MIQKDQPRTPSRVTAKLVGYSLLLIFIPLFVFAGKAFLEDRSLEALLFSLYALIFVVGSIGLVRIGATYKLARIIWVLFSLAILTSILLQFQYKNTALLLGLLVLFFIILAAPATLPRRQTALVMLIGMVNLVLIIIIDLLGNPDRDLMMPSNMTNVMVAGLVILALIISAVNFPRYPIRMKFILSVVIVSVFSAGMVLYFSGQNSMNLVRSTAFDILSAAAQQSATALDSLIFTNLSVVRSGGQLDLVNQFLRAPIGETRDEIEIQLRSRLQSLEESQGLSGQSATIQDYFREFLLLNINGIVVLDTAKQQGGRNLSGADFFLQTISSGQAYMSPVDFSLNDEPSVYFSYPIKDREGQALGILASRYSADFLQFVMNQYNDLARDGSFAILVDENQLRLAQGNAPEQVFKSIVPLANTSRLQALGRLPAGNQVEISTDLKELSARLINSNRQPAFSYQGFPDNELLLAFTAKLESQPWLLIYTQREDVFLQPIALFSRNLQILTVFIVAGAALLAFILTQWVTSPIQRLNTVANAIVAGDLSARARVESDDEIGTLAETMNNMTGRLQYTLTSLEQRVRDRTRALERRSALMQAAAEIGRVAATIRDPEVLFDQLTQMISDRFGFYHVGIFIVDDAGEYSILKSANSEGGKRLVAKGHKLKIGVQGLVGYVTSTGKPRVALEVGLDTQYFDNPDMPLTRSEVALPLNAAGITFGALDVQSTEAGAFSDEDITIFQILADLIAVAIENARLFSDSQQAIDATRRAYGELSSRSWQEMLNSERQVGYRSLDRGIMNAGMDWDEPSLQVLREGQLVHVQDDRQRISVPVKIRNMVVAVIDIYKPPEQGAWEDQEISSLMFIAEQVGIALESSRLYEGSQQQTHRERLVADIAARVRESLDIDIVLQTAVQEMGQRLNLSEAVVRMDTVFSDVGLRNELSYPEAQDDFSQSPIEPSSGLDLPRGKNNRKKKGNGHVPGSNGSQSGDGSKSAG